VTTEPFHWLFDPLIALSIDPYAVKPMIDQHPGLDLLNAFLFFRSVYQKHSYPSQTVILLKENEAFIFLPKFLALVSLDLRPLIISTQASAFTEKLLREDIDFEIDPVRSSPAEFLTDFDQPVAGPQKITKIQNIQDMLKASKSPINDREFLILSSGSDQKPKIIIHQVQNILKSVQSYSAFFKVNPNECVLLQLPLFHVSGMMQLFRAYLNHQAIVTKFDRQKKIHSLSLVPTQVKKIIDQASNDSDLCLDDLRNVTYLLIGGAPLTQDLAHALDVAAITYYETYGMTETLSMVCINGTPLPGVSLLTENNILYLSAPSLCLGFYRQKIRHSIDGIARGGIFYYRTQDSVHFSDGKIADIKRADRVIISGGKKVSLDYVSELITQTLKISPNEFTLMRIPHPYWGERFILYLKDHLSSTMLTSLSLNLEAHYRPLKIITATSLFLQNGKIKYSDKYNALLDHLFTQHVNMKPQTEVSTILFHGFMESPSDWEKVIERVCELNNQNNKSFLAMPLLGHEDMGENSPIDDYFYNLEHYIDHLADWMRQNFEIQNPHFSLIGYSMGGRLAALLAIKLNIKNICIISSSLGETNKQIAFDRLQNDLKLGKNIHHTADYLAFLKTWYQQPIFGTYKDMPNFENEIKEKSKRTFQAFFESLKILSVGNYPTQENFTLMLNQHLKQYLRPLEFIVGDKDQKYLMIANELKTSLSDLLVVTEIKNSAHNMHKTHFNELCNALNSFLQRSKSN